MAGDERAAEVGGCLEVLQEPGQAAARFRV
jgi:hypothetical protein